MAGKRMISTGAVIGGVVGLITGIVALTLTDGSGDSLAIVDPGAPAAAMLTLAAALVVGALAGGVIAYMRR